MLEDSIVTRYTLHVRLGDPAFVASTVEVPTQIPDLHEFCFWVNATRNSSTVTLPMGFVFTDIDRSPESPIALFAPSIEARILGADKGIIPCVLFHFTDQEEYGAIKLIHDLRAEPLLRPENQKFGRFNISYVRHLMLINCIAYFLEFKRKVPNEVRA